MKLLAPLLFSLLLSSLLFSCNRPAPGCEINDFDAPATCDFHMGFTSWIYAPTQQAKDDTYSFLQQNGDIYAEHLDDRIPWTAWMNNEDLPADFVAEVNSRLAYRDPDMKLLLSVSLLNSARTDLIEDWDGTSISYTQLDDTAIEEAYFDHLSWLIDRFEPDYLVSAIEGNELLKHSPDKWEAYKSLMDNIRGRLKQAYPDLPTAESMTLHNFYLPDVADPTDFVAEVSQRLNQQDFAAISFYPFFKGLTNTDEFQLAFDFLHAQTDLPIAFVETAHLAEDLDVEAFNLHIPSDECQQAQYLATLLHNAVDQDYEFVIWWAHRDFDALWETFPESVKDLGKLWRDTGLLDEDGNERAGMEVWSVVDSR